MTKVILKRQRYFVDHHRGPQQIVNIIVEN